MPVPKRLSPMASPMASLRRRSAGAIAPVNPSRQPCTPQRAASLPAGFNAAALSNPHPKWGRISDRNPQQIESEIVEAPAHLPAPYRGRGQWTGDRHRGEARPPGDTLGTGTWLPAPGYPLATRFGSLLPWRPKRCLSPTPDSAGPQEPTRCLSPTSPQRPPRSLRPPRCLSPGRHQGGNEPNSHLLRRVFVAASAATPPTFPSSPLKTTFSRSASRSGASRPAELGRSVGRWTVGRSGESSGRSPPKSDGV